MGRGGEAGARRNKRRTRFREDYSDDSDADYMVEEDEEDRFDEYFSNEEDERWVVQSVDRSRGRGGSLSQKKTGVKRSQKKKSGSYEEEDTDDDSCHSDDNDDDEFSLDDIDSVDEEEEFVVNNKHKNNTRKVSGPAIRKIGVERSLKRKRVSYEEEDLDGDCCYDDDDDDDDDEFAPDEIDSVDEEEELPVYKKKKNGIKVGGRAIRKKCPNMGKRRKKKKGRNNGGLMRKASCTDDDELVERNPISRVKSKKKVNRWRKRRRYAALSDSDFVSSESSDHEYNISEEERDLVSEASAFCRSRSSGSLKRIQDNKVLHQQRKSLRRKGKEKIKDPQNEVVEQVCGICLSEEAEGTVRGILNCCSHYFCFTCIMEWSKVESRCPFCKQRFVTITKLARPNTGVDLRNVVIQVPERDQVYQPSEEEMQIFFNPYDYVICTECREGGEDGLMLLCDLCDSPAHTYCVGLGREVPEGNWYCEGCRPIALGSSYVQAQDFLPGHRMASSSSSNRRPHADVIDTSPIPHAPFTRGFRTLTTSAHTVGNFQAASPLSGAGPSTLSGRRQMHRQIHDILSSRIMAHIAGRTDGNFVANSAINPVNPLGSDAWEPTFQRERTPEIGRFQHNFIEETVPNSPSPQLQNRNPLSGRLSLFRRQLVLDSSTTATDGSVRGTSRDDC